LRRSDADQRLLGEVLDQVRVADTSGDHPSNDMVEVEFGFHADTTFARDAVPLKAFLSVRDSTRLPHGRNDEVTEEMNRWLDRRALDNRGTLLGVVVDIYADVVSRRPEWLAISTGFFGTRVAVVPVRAASLLGDDVVIAHDRETITSAPMVDVLVAVDPRQQQLLLDHYACPTTAKTDLLSLKEVQK
jgi:hypothetical protein